MNLRVVTPTETIVEEEVRKVTVHGGDGSRTYLPRHVDFVSTTAISVMSWVSEDGEEKFAAIDEGVVVKVGDELRVSTTFALHGPPLGELRETVEEQLDARGQEERTTRRALARIESNILRRFADLG